MTQDNDIAITFWQPRNFQVQCFILLGVGNGLPRFLGQRFKIAFQIDFAFAMYTPAATLTGFNSDVMQPTRDRIMPQQRSRFLDQQHKNRLGSVLAVCRIPKETSTDMHHHRRVSPQDLFQRLLIIVNNKQAQQLVVAGYLIFGEVVHEQTFGEQTLWRVEHPAEINPAGGLIFLCLPNPARPLVFSFLPDDSRN